MKEKQGMIFGYQSAADCYINDRLGQLGAVVNHKGLYIASGWGGTAFKFALEIGYRMLNAFEDGRRVMGINYAI